jgi:UDP-N-acetylglucosamine 2-epimerase (non-hydrolysing)
MSKVFFQELNIREPDFHLGIGGLSLFRQIATLFTGISDLIDKIEPDRMLVLGDTNSALSAFVGKRKGIPVYHMEAGNRCFDEIVPEEDNRKVIDHCSDIHMPYTERSRQNLKDENIPAGSIFVIGNPIYEVLKDFKGQSNILKTLVLEKQKYFLLTAHRQENVDSRERLRWIMLACRLIKQLYKMTIIFSCHPRTRENLKVWNIGTEGVEVCEPFGFTDFYELERNACCLITDSGTVQEEACILHVPCVTIRDTTERPETVECGSNILSGVDPDDVMGCVNTALIRGTNWIPPVEYLKEDVSDVVAGIVTSYFPNNRRIMPVVGRKPAMAMD